MPAAESAVKYTNTSANTRAQTLDRCIIFAERCVHRFNSDNVAGNRHEIMEEFFEIKTQSKPASEHEREIIFYSVFLFRFLFLHKIHA